MSEFHPVREQLEYEPRFMELVGDYVGSAGLSMFRMKPMYAREHDLVLATRTGETVLVESVSEDLAVVRRGVGSTSCPLVDGDELLIVGRNEPA